MIGLRHNSEARPWAHAASWCAATAKERSHLMEAEVLTLHEAADYLRVHPRTLRLKAVEGIVPGAKVGRVWRFHKQQLEQWLLDGGALNSTNPARS